AWWFSCLHFQVGFPSGFIGMGLTFVFGLMMAYLVGRTNGLLLPVVIHFLADVTVVSLVVLRMGGVV
ncbi:MAG: type II CAAX prenyl endopeptidase Rce1 family protein, partial [bacterium]